MDCVVDANQSQQPELPLRSGLLIDGFINSVVSYPDRPALNVNDADYSYRELADMASQIAAAIQQQDQSEPLVGVLAHKSVTAYAGILGVLLSGNAYVPLQPHHPVERILHAIEIPQLETVVVGTEALKCLEGLLPSIKRPMRFIIPQANQDQLEALKATPGQHEFFGQDDASPQSKTISRPDSTEDDIAYVIFTSGSTGVPKGVVVRNRNVVPFVSYMAQRCNATSEDRFSQISDLTFDLSIFPVWALSLIHI